MTTTVHHASHNLSRFRPGSVREMLILFTPLIFSIFSGSLMSFCDRLFASHYALGSLKAMTTANYFCLLFQQPVCRVAAMVQVCIGKSYGEGKIEVIGPYCWQMIWFSILSMGITLPVGMGLIPYLFEGTAVAHEGDVYFKILMYGNFLFPLGTALSSYFIGLGRTKVVGICSFGAQIMNVGLNYVLIFGSLPWIPALGLRGAALGTVIAQAILCLILLVLFLRKHQDYCIRKWSFNKALFKEVFFLGIPRSLARIMVMITWNIMAVRLIIGLEGDYLLVLAVGSSICLMYSPIKETLMQVLTTQASFYRGKKHYSVIWKSIRSAMVFLLICFCALGLFFLFYLDFFLSFFIHESISAESLRFIRLACLWIWILFFLEGFFSISNGLVMGLGLTLFAFKLSALTSLPTVYLPNYLAFQYWHLNPDKIWVLCWINVILMTTINFAKASRFLKKLAFASEEKGMSQSV